ncbi:MAG: sigma-54-dependent transcriptional regulator [Puniceicoccaceae bacterium]
MSKKPRSKGTPSRILIVEDDASFLALLSTELEEAGFSVTGAGNLADARAVIGGAGSGIDLVLSDLRLPDGEGAELLAETVRMRIPPAFIALTAFGTIEQAVDLLKSGADNFLPKPVDFDQLRISVERALDYRRMKYELDRLQSAAGEGFHGMIGKSRAMKELIHGILRVAPTEEAVLLTGESGTGKELAARAIHEESGRAGGPFVPVNCAAIPNELMESELFGHESGAFTGASSRKEGLFRAASGGTLFLDEIGDLSESLQAKILRALQEGRIRPVGSAREVEADARIIAATHRDLAAEAGEGRFRKDLYYRLEALTLSIPPLRRRRGDIPLLAGHLLREASEAMGRSVGSVDNEVLEAFEHYEFPGNIREMANIIKKMLVFAGDDGPLGTDLLPPSVRGAAESAAGAGASPPGGSRPASFTVSPPFPPMEEMRRRYLEHVLDHSGGNKKRAAEILGIGRRTLYEILERGGD